MNIMLLLKSFICLACTSEYAKARVHSWVAVLDFATAGAGIYRAMLAVGKTVSRGRQRYLIRTKEKY
jgi:hypothetical protein